jgi:hypothetical protein
VSPAPAAGSNTGACRITRPNRLDRYAWLAWFMVSVGVVGIPLVFINLVSPFWLEIAVALLFAVFWFVQTIDIRDQRLATDV